MITDPLLGAQVGDYVIHELLGVGGMGRVYRARHRSLKRDAAIKVIEPEFQDDPAYTELFRNEARSIFRLEHPHIVRFQQFGTTHGFYYLAVDFVDGRDLRWVLDDYKLRGELIPPDDALAVLDQVAQALDYIHAGRLVHRDVKPSNILLDRRGRAFLTDFGMVLNLSEQTQAEAFGSAHYVAPEQVSAAANAVPQSDVYALGIILYEILTGELPFEADTPLALALKQVSEPPPPPRSINLDLHPALEAVVLRALAKEPAARYPSASALVDALRRELRQPAAEQPAALAQLPAASDPAGPSGSEPVANCRSVSTRRLLNILAQLPEDAQAAANWELPRHQRGTARHWPPRLLLAFGLAMLQVMLCAMPVIASIRGIEVFAQALPADTAVRGVRRMPESKTGAVLRRPVPAALDTAAGPDPTLAPPTVQPPTPTAALPPDSQVPPPNVRLVYDLESASVINISGAPLSLAGVTFARPAGDQTALFESSIWHWVAARSVAALPAADCLQVRRYGTRVSRPAGCDSLQGWLTTSRIQWYFWVPVEGIDWFQVWQNGVLVNTCAIPEGECAFYLPQP